MFTDDVVFQRLWRRIAQRYPFARDAKYLDSVERLYRLNAEYTYDSLKALSEERQRMEPTHIEAFFAQLFILQTREAQGVDPAFLLEPLTQLGVERAWRWFNFGVHHAETHRATKPDALHSFFALENETAQAVFEGLKQGASAHEISRILRYYAEALTGPGWPLKLIPHDSTTPADLDTLYLPDHLLAYPHVGGDGDDLHFLLYKWLITHELSHRYGGTYRVGDTEDQEAGRIALTKFIRGFSDPLLAEALFHLFEDVRIEAYLLRQYPGFHADRNALMDLEFCFRSNPFSERERFLEALVQQLHWGKTRFPLPKHNQAAFNELLDAALGLSQPSSTVEDALRLTEKGYELLDGLFDEPRLTQPLFLSLLPYEPTLQLDPPRAATTQQRYVQTWREESSEEIHQDPLDEKGADDLLKAQPYRYDEWDYRANQYRSNWCALRNQAPAEAATVSALHEPHVAQVRRAFEWMAEEDWKRQRRQLEGDELDLEAWVEGAVDRRVGLPLPEKIYTQQLRKNRDLCAAIVLDQSDSTARLTPNGQPVINVEREALRYLCEALEALRDEYAIYSYSGDGRGQVDCFTLKAFDERYGLTVQHRLEALTPLAQNRDGCALRHVTRRMSARSARTKLLLHITDGKPWDHGYTQRYGLEDTKKAIQEARAQGVKVFGVICDPYAPAYVKDTYGKGRVVVLRKVNELSELLLGLYRRITW